MNALVEAQSVGLTLSSVTERDTPDEVKRAWLTCQRIFERASFFQIAKECTR